MPIGGAFCPLPERLGGSPEEGWSPEQHARLCADLVAAKRTAKLARFTYVQTGTGPTDYTFASYLGQNGNGLLYAPTSITVHGTGDMTLAYASQYFEDEYGYQHPFRIRKARAQAHYDAAAPTVKAMVEIVTRGVRVRVVDAGGTARNARVSVTVS